MSTPLPPQYAPFQTQPPAPKKRFNWKLALIVFAAVLIGGVIGSVSNPAPPPVVHVEKELVEIEKEVYVPQTPQACLTALDLNEQAFGYMSESLGYVNEGDYVAAEKSTERITDLVPEVNAAKAACRAEE